jgi:structural maintenance of chromosome 4
MLMEHMLQELEKHTNEVSKELVAFEREDVQMQEKRKHLANKQKKLKKTIHDDTNARSEASTWHKSYGEDMEKLKAELEKHETNLAREEAELEKICDGLKDKTAGFSAQIDTKQAELQPWLDRLSEKQAAVDLARNQRDLLTEKAASIEEAKQSLEEIQADSADKEEQLAASKEEYAQIKSDLQQLKAELEVCPSSFYESSAIKSVDG